MKDWKSLEHAAQCAKTEREKRKAQFAIIKLLEKVSLPELKEIVGTAKDEFIKEQAEVELWWRKFDKNPKNLLNFIRTSNDKNKIGNAIIELGNLKCRDAVSTLIGFLDDIDLRDPAASALRKMPTQEAFRPLVQSIKRYPNGAECLLYALQVLDCSDAAELLVDLFILKPDAPAVRDAIFVCFAKKAVKRIPKQVKDACRSKIMSAMKESQDQSNTKELRQFYEVLSQVEEN
jgi:HEAT repeat protein